MARKTRFPMNDGIGRKRVIGIMPSPPLETGETQAQ